MEKREFCKKNLLFQTAGIVVYSIGMTDGANYSQLLEAATSEDYVRQYKNFSDFESEVPAILFDTCDISVPPYAVRNGVAFDIRNILQGEARVVQLTYPMTNNVLLLDFIPASKDGDAVLFVFVNCDGSVPSRVFYDDVQRITFKENEDIPVSLKITSCATKSKFL